MFRFIKQIFISTIMYFDSLSNLSSLEFISMKNEECKVRPEIVNINSNDPIFYPFNTKKNKCSSNCNNVSYPYARNCVPDIVKNLNIKLCVNVKNKLIKVYAIKDLFGILVIGNVNVVNLAILVDI